jgi:CRISPR-associated protein Csx3
MAKPIFTLSEVQYGTYGFKMISFEIPGGITSPAEFSTAISEMENKLTGNLPILINGRGPIWGYGMLFHIAHATPAIAVYDPRLGYVIVQSHDSRFRVGEILTIEA